jgi:integrase
MKFTNQLARALQLPAGKNDAIFFDDGVPGFGLRIRDGGKRTWILQYRLGKTAEGRWLSHRMTLGTTTELTETAARAKALKALASVREGVDPKKKLNERHEQAAQTIGRIRDSYFELKAVDLAPRSLAEIKRHLCHHWAPFKNTPLADISRLDINERITEIAKENGLITANRARASLSAFFVWAMKQGLVAVNPVVATNKAVKEKSRERVLAIDELVTVWKACGDDDYGRIVRLLILTGQRCAEIAGISEAELKRDDRILHLPSARTKNRKPHDVPLSDAAMAILPAPRANDERNLLFGRGKGPFSGWSHAKQRLDKRITASAPDGKALAPWTLHDLRRTASTGMNHIKILPHVVEAVLNHISGHLGGIAGVYNHHKYADEKRDALDRWAAHVGNLVRGNVVPFAPRTQVA